MLTKKAINKTMILFIDNIMDIFFKNNILMTDVFNLCNTAFLVKNISDEI